MEIRLSACEGQSALQRRGCVCEKVLGLVTLCFGLTISVRSIDSLEFKDWVLPLAVGG